MAPKKRSGPAAVGFDLLRGTIYGAEHVDEKVHAIKMSGRFMRTPVHSEVPRGRHLHIGDGIFLFRCPECDAYVRSYGGILVIPAFDQHLEQEHGIITGPLLPPPRPRKARTS